MKVSLEKGSINAVQDEVLAILLMEGEKPPKELSMLLGHMRKEQFSGKAGQSYAVTAHGKFRFERLLLVGLGEKKKCCQDSLRRAAAVVIRYCIANRLAAATVQCPKLKAVKPGEAVRALTEGAVLSNFVYDFLKTEKKDTFRVSNFSIIGSCSKDEQKGMERGWALANAQNYVRYLQELPGNIFTPERAAEEAKKLAGEKKLSVKIYGKADLERMKMNGILAVNQGSDKEPRLVRLDYNAKKKGLPLFALVGKGVCFDAGGINLKPTKGMEEMKYDKTGALCVLGIFMAAADLELPVRLVGLMPFVENMPSGTAQRPGDVVKMYNGKTVEVLNTDAEGRMILADSLAYAAEHKPKAMIDLATLTGAMIVALGRAGSGFFTDDDRLAKAICSASCKSGEKVWRMPMWPEFHELVKGTYGDIRNVTNTGEAGSATAACFLSNFVGKTPWVHIDIAGADHAGVSKPHPYLAKGAAGPCVRLVALALEELAKKK